MEQSIQLPLDTKAIMAILPHRYPFLMVDRITALDPGKTITGIKNITMNEMCFLGHFPGEPVMPGSLPGCPRCSRNSGACARKLKI